MFASKVRPRHDVQPTADQCDEEGRGSGDKNVMRILTPWSNTGVGMVINPVGIYTTILRIYSMGWMTINHVPWNLSMADIMKGAHIPDIS
jgi:hypothetical protein